MTQKQAKANIFSTPYLTRMAILVAIASILFLVEIPVVAFYKLDLSNIPVLLGAFSMGTVPGVIILALKSLIGLMHSSSAGVGELADFLMGAAFVIPAAKVSIGSNASLTELHNNQLYYSRSELLFLQKIFVFFHRFLHAAIA